MGHFSVEIIVPKGSVLSGNQHVDDKAPNEAVAFKQLLKTIAEQTAEASKEGGFLGFGGVRVSDAEKASVAEVAATLRA